MLLILKVAAMLVSYMPLFLNLCGVSSLTSNFSELLSLTERRCTHSQVLRQRSPSTHAGTSAAKQECL
ncbi:MAG: hypothetical protein KME15_14700 [Drouetiella hepatica Uher 2000/2452]|uniref:Uncharacterized protein n=1 Tax=Drouetiella hepatica Uher 2000/2452 TaxID=904376 RepID=A0A951QBY2_9CYAN|nr:hypothetical protein [Drouetiella hepatica Uher 2000/2452]